MSALALRKLVKHSEFQRHCEQQGCKRMGRVAMSIAGLPVWSEKPLGNRPEQAQLCNPCAKEVKKLWNELAGRTQEDAVLTQLAQLGGTTVDRVDAISELRHLGYSRDGVAMAVKATADRKPLEDVLDALGEMQAVA